MGTVIHAHHRDRLFAVKITGIQKRSNFPDIAFRLFGARRKIRFYRGKRLSFAVYEAVSFLRNGKRYHLEGIFTENLFQPAVFFFVSGIQNTGFHNAADNRLFYVSVGFQRHENCIIIMRTIHFFNNFIVKAFRHHKASIQNALVQETLNNICLKCTENVSGAEMNPEGRFFCCRRNRFSVKFRKRIACSFPLCSVFQSCFT